MKTIQEIAKETRELLSDLKNGHVQLPKEECPERLWSLRGYLASDDEWNRLDTILCNIEIAQQELDDIDEYFEPTTEDNVNELWGWLIIDQSHIQLVEESIHEYYTVNPAKNHDLYDSIGRALLKKEYEIFLATKAYIMEIYNDRPEDDDEDEDCDGEE